MSNYTAEQIEATRFAMQEQAVAKMRGTAYTRVITSAEAELSMSENHVTQTDFARHEVFDRERDEKVTRLETVFASHLQDYAELKQDVKTGNATGRRIENKLSNGISDKLKHLEETVVGAARVKSIIHEEAAGAKKRGREWLLALTALCAVAATVVGILL